MLDYAANAVVYRPPSLREPLRELVIEPAA
jgi:hypothetical protein